MYNRNTKKRITGKVKIGTRVIKTSKGQQRTLPIKDKRLLNRVIDYLIFEREHAKSNKKYYLKYRNYMLILIGINTAFRAEDLLQLKVKNIEKGYMSIKENKTGKVQNFPLNKKLHTKIMEYVNEFNLKSNDYLFMGQKSKNTYKGITRKIIYPITRQNCSALFKKISEDCGITFNFGLHSLRKTFGYMYILNGGKLVTLQKMYNHDKPTTTLFYVMWDSADLEAERAATFLGDR